MADELEVLAREPSLRGIEQAVGVACIARDAREREARTLPHVVVVDLRDRAGNSVYELCLDRPQMHALLLQGVTLREEELERVETDESLRHAHIEAIRPVVRIPFGPEGVRNPAGYGALMGRFLVLASTIAALSLVTTPMSPAASRSAHTVLHYGDSLTVGTGLYLSTFLPGWSITQSASISRHADEGPAAVRSLSSALPRVLVISLGANDDPGAVTSFAASVRRIALAAGTDRCVIWSTVVRPPYNGVSYAGYNRVLRRAATTYPNFVVFDWQALARAHPRWVSGDGVHPTADGYRARAAALAKLIRSC